MKLQISYYPSDDLLLMHNGKKWKSGANIAEHVVFYTDLERNPTAIEISGARKVLDTLLRMDYDKGVKKDGATSKCRPNEYDVDRVTLPLTVT